MCSEQNVVQVCQNSCKLVQAFWSCRQSNIELVSVLCVICLQCM